MQHITIENFWPKKSKSATPEPYRDPSMVKVMQELLVKRDLSRGWIHPMSSKLLSTMSTYECVTFLKGSAVNLVELFKMSVSPTGQINITQRMIDLTNLSDSDSVERLCQRIVEQLDSVSWTQWQWIDYVLCFEGDLLTVMTTQRYVMLDEPAISSLLSGGSPKQIVDPEVVIGALEKIQEDQTQIQGYQEAVAQLLDDIQNLPQETWTLGYLKQYLKGKIDLSSKVPYQITFQTKAQKAVIADLYKVSGINFDASARRKADEANVIGLKGMGLTVIDGAYHYFVGTHQPLNTTVEKATKFRKIIPAFDNQYSVEYHYQNMQIMMAVNFVNSARYTVRPPQVKYLREYQNQQLRLRQVALQE